MRKETVKKTYIYTNDEEILCVFGFDFDENDLQITKRNIDYLKLYVDELENDKLKDFLSIIEEELKDVDEVEVVNE